MEDSRISAGTLSSYESRGPLLKLTTAMARNKYERTFMLMARASENTAVLDLTNPSANALAKTIANITVMYARDFPKIEDLQSPAGTVTHNIQASPAVSNATELQVTVESVVTNEDDYNVRLAKWNKDVADHESHIISNYVNTHVHIVVDDLRDVDKIKKKMQRIPVLSEKKKKAVHQRRCADTPGGLGD